MIDATALPSVRRGVKSPKAYGVHDAAANQYFVAHTKPEAVRLINRMVDGSWIQLVQLGVRLPGVWVKEGGRLVARDNAPGDYLKSEYRSNRPPSARRRLRHNPPLVTFGNPPRGEIMSKRVFEVAYKHTADGKAYKHEFAAGVCMEALPDGSIRIYSMRGKRLWGDF